MRSSVSFQVDIFVLATKDYDTFILMVHTHLVPKIMHQNLSVILRQFIYGKNSFIVLIPDCSFCSISCK